VGSSRLATSRTIFRGIGGAGYTSPGFDLRNAAKFGPRRTRPAGNWKLKCVALGHRADFNKSVSVPSYFPTEADLTLNGAAQAAWHERAAAATRVRFGRQVFVRGVVEVSNYCRENCAYCGMRRDNRKLSRYRARHEELAELLIHHRPPSVTDVNIQAGEDPVAVREVVLPLIQALRRETSLGISVCLGTLTPSLYDELKSAGAAM